MRAEYPSAQSPSLPAVSIDIPDGWTLKPHANALVAAYDPSSPALSRTTVYVTAGRIIGDITLDEIVARNHRSLRDAYPQSELQFTKPGTLDGREARFSAMTVQGADLRVPLLRTETTVLVPTTAPGVHHIVQLMCKCSGTSARENARVFASIARSLTISQ